MSAQKRGEKTVADVMKRDVITVPAEATLQEVATLLTAQKISGAPVVDENNNMVGIISESDLLSEARKHAGLPHAAAFGFFILPQETLERLYKNGSSLLAREVMTKKVTTITPDIRIDEVGDLMVRSKINRIPVVDEQDRLVGIITREDILRALYHVADNTAQAAPTSTTPAAETETFRAGSD
ncbi:MAG: CBS domain-containing protein [Armatimonadaceae bacterium]